MRATLAPLADETAGLPVPFQPAPSHRILVAEDDEDIRRLNTEALIHRGYHVDVAEDGAVAWDALQRNNYDLLVTDNNMPKVTGVELLKKLRAGRMELPVIMATGTLPEAEFARHPWLQPAATLLKSYTVEAFLKAVATVLRLTDSPRELVTTAAHVETRPDFIDDGD